MHLQRAADVNTNSHAKRQVLPMSSQVVEYGHSNSQGEDGKGGFEQAVIGSLKGFVNKKSS
jgi:hypothetical protein